MTVCAQKVLLFVLWFYLSCETEQIQNNEKSRNLYVSRKLPCTKSPNSWLSASSWTESKFKSSWTESKSLVAKILPYFDVLCLWLACLEQLHDVENNALKGQKISFQQNLGGSNIIWMFVTQEKDERCPRKIRLAPSWPHHRPGSLNHTFNPVSKTESYHIPSSEDKVNFNWVPVTTKII